MSGQVLILGGGIAGLTAALHLRERGFQVTVTEQAPHVGGRLSHAPPPMLLGAHTATWALLKELEQEPSLQRLRHTPIEFLQADGGRVQFLHLPLPSPLNTLLGTTLFQGLSMRDRWHLLSFLERTWEQDPPLPNDLEMRSADEWLAGIGQSEQARRGVWNTLSRFLLGASLAQASAAIFMRTLRRSFFTGARATKMIVPQQNAAACLIAPLKARLDAMGVVFQFNRTASHIRFDSDRVSSVQFTDRQSFTADWYISALPRRHLTALLSERVVTHYAYFQQLGRLTESPLVLVHLHLDQPSTETQVTLLEQRPFHWLICQPDHTLQAQTSNVWAVAVGAPELAAKDDRDLISMATEEVRRAFHSPIPAPILRSRCHREERGILDVGPGAQQHRPLPQSPFRNFLIAGDWTDTGWPAVLESAILSGQRCAAAVGA
ncbi:MAG: FAD-dependent oxidoreductase [Nitrospiraceae bacterium]|nr:FAD-dependent oxidoreductase [Nitrospiraceae bacterium]